MNKMDQLLQRYKTKSVVKNKPEKAPQDSVRRNQIPDPQSAAAPKPNRPTGGNEVPFDVKLIINPDEAQKLVETELIAKGVIGLDIETMKDSKFRDNDKAGLSPHLSAIRLVQLCQSPGTVYVFDVLKTKLEPLLPAFSEPLVAHNALFEMSHLFHIGIRIPHADCTMLMYNAIFGGLSSLKDLARKELHIDISKEEQKSDWSLDELSPAQIRYAAADAWVVRQLYQVMAEKIAKLKKQEVYRLLQEAQYPVMKMMYSGCHFDAPSHYWLTEKNKADLTEAEARLKKVVGANINLHSGKQLSDHYKKTLNPKILANWNRTESGNLCLDKDTVKKFSYIEAVAPLAEFKTLNTQVSNFGDKLISYINPVTGRLHPSYTIAGAKTGRFTCSKPNLQQIPAEVRYRRLFSAPPGRKIAVADYSQLELRVLAMLSKDSVMLEAYKNGEDLHRLTASSMAGVPPGEVTKEQRSAAKAVNFGIAYGMTANGLMESAWKSYGVKMTQKSAKENISSFNETYPDAKKFLSGAVKTAALYRRANTKTGRSIFIDKNPKTQGRNYPIQGSAGEVLLAALAELEKAIAASGLDIIPVNTIHDEIVLEVADAHAEQAASLLEKAMIDGMLRIFPEAETTGLVEAGIGSSWGEAK